MPTTNNVFIQAYTECALWSEGYEGGELHLTAQERFADDCKKFITENEHLFEGNYSQAGHDFWLTRNGHGAGFWDRTEIYGEENANKLTEASKAFGECWLTADDGFIYTV